MKKFYYIVEPPGVDEKHPYWVPKWLELLIGIAKMDQPRSVILIKGENICACFRYKVGFLLH